MALPGHLLGPRGRRPPRRPSGDRVGSAGHSRHQHRAGQHDGAGLALQREGFTNASTDIYRSDWSDSPTGFDYGIRPTADGFLAIGLTPMQVNYLRGRGGVVSLVSTVGGWALGSQSSPTAWRVLRDGSTLILGEQREYDSTQDIVTFGCAVYSATDTATTCPAPKGRVTGALGVGASTVLLATSDGLWRRPRPTAQDERVSGELGRGVEAMDAARGSRVAWVATRAGAGEGSVLSRYVAR